MNILVLDENLASVAIIDSFESLIWTDRYYEAGDFELYTAASVRLLQILKPDYYLWIKESEHMMIIEGVEISSNPEEGNKLIVTGRSLESILDRRIILGQTNVDDTLQNGIKKILKMNIINPIDETRKINNFIFEDSEDINIQSLFLQTQYNGENLYDSIVDICKSNGIGFKITLNDNNEFVFKLYYGKDKTYNQLENITVIFSNTFDNLINSDYISTKRDFKTVTIVGGEGEGDDRIMIGVSISSGAGEGLNRRESYTDCHGTSRKSGGQVITYDEYLAQLVQKGFEDLSNHIITEAFEGEITNTVFKYGKDFEIGDIVEIENDYGNISQPRIIEYIYSQSNEEFKNYPTFGYDEYNPEKYRNEDCFLVQVYDKDTEETSLTNSWCDKNTPLFERYFNYGQIAQDSLVELWKDDSLISYTCRLTQYVYCEEDKSVNTSIKIGTKGSLYLNNVLLTTSPIPSVMSIILNFSKGWNKIEIIFNDTFGYLSADLYEEDDISHAVPDYKKVKI